MWKGIIWKSVVSRERIIIATRYAADLMRSLQHARWLILAKFR